MAANRTARGKGAPPRKPRKRKRASRPPAAAKPTAAHTIAEIGRGIARVVGDVGAVAAGATRRGSRHVAAQVAAPIDGLTSIVKSTVRSVTGGPAKRGRKPAPAR